MYKVINLETDKIYYEFWNIENAQDEAEIQSQADHALVAVVDEDLSMITNLYKDGKQMF